MRAGSDAPEPRLGDERLTLRLLLKPAPLSIMLLHSVLKEAAFYRQPPARKRDQASPESGFGARGTFAVVHDPHRTPAPPRLAPLIFWMLIPTRQVIYEALKSRKGFASFKEVSALLGTTPKQAPAVRNRLKAMVRDGQLACDDKGGYRAAREARRVTGVFIASDRGASVKLDSPEETYLELPWRLTRALVDGDKVAVDLVENRAGATAGDIDEVTDEGFPVAVEVLARDREVAGVVAPNGCIEPLHEIGQDEVRVLAGGSSPKAAAVKSGDVVVVHLRKPKSGGGVAGEIIEVLGERESAGMEVDVVLRTYNVPCRWRREALDEAERCTAVSQRDFAGREDLRETGFVTIDGEDAKDFDDAIFFEKRGDGWRLWVAIADVASYVKPGGALDAAAYERGNSFYFPGRVVPMLPPVLSDGLCSLRPDEERLALVCRVNLSSQGEIEGYEFVRAVIRSHARMTYTEVGRFLQAGGGLDVRPAQVRDMLREGVRAFERLVARRRARGALEIDVTETRMLFDEHGMVRRIVPFERNDAHRLIEECMICANVCAAKFLAERDCGLLYRVHAGLKKEAVEDLKFFLRERGLRLDGERNVELARLLEEAAGRDDAHAVQSVILRSLTRALYQPDNAGHYGLALSLYAHFTSPIRRYPDLLVHRAIHAVLDGDAGAGKRYAGDELKAIGGHCSETEKVADDATRAVAKYLKCLYVQDRIGERFTGIVVGVTNFGLFIELDKVYVEGLLHVASLDSDYYFFDAPGHRLVGESSGKVYRLGDRIEVVLVRVAPEERKIDFALPSAAGSRRPRRRGRR